MNDEFDYEKNDYNRNEVHDGLIPCFDMKKNENMF